MSDKETRISRKEAYNRALSLITKIDKSTIIEEVNALPLSKISTQGIDSIFSEESTTIIKNLKAFGRQHVEFFYSGHINDNPLEKYELEFTEQNGYTLEYAMRIISQRISLDYEVWRQIFNQRPANLQDTFKTQLQRYYSESATAVERWFSVLSMSDFLADYALGVASALGYFKDYATLNQNKILPESLSYFATRPSMRVVPYVPYALVAVPYTAMAIPQDLLAIPHEIGHFIYWHGNLNNVPIHKLFENDDDLWTEWGEEIFADVFGTYVAGELMGYDFLHYLQSHTQTEFINSHDRHPIPAMRLFIHIEALKHFGANNYGDSLDIEWRKYLLSRSITDEAEFSVDRILTKKLNALNSRHDDLQATEADKPSKDDSSSEGDTVITIKLNDFVSKLRNSFSSKKGIFKAFEPMNQSTFSEVNMTTRMLDFYTKKYPDEPTASCLEVWKKLTHIHNWSEIVTDGAGIKDNSPFDSNVSDSTNLLSARETQASEKSIWQTWFEINEFAPKDGSKELKINQWLKVLDAGDWTTEGPHSVKEDG